MIVRLLALLSILLLQLASPVQAQDRIWSAVLIARNVDEPKAAPKEIAPVSKRLTRLFGYNTFEMVGSEVKQITDGAEQTLTPTKAFWLKVKARRARAKEARGGYLLNLELYQENRPLVDTVAMIAPESPLIFRGPMHARGQVLVVLQVLP